MVDVARVEAGQSVLIHSACGGVGQAAVQICRVWGAVIFATVGSEAKIQHLTSLGVAKDHIFSSRDTSSHDGIIQQTNRKGVDFVLNSLSGRLFHTSWSSVAPYGTMIGLGKRDIEGYGKLDMRPFLANRSYACVDLAQIIQERPDKIGAILRRLAE